MDKCLLDVNIDCTCNNKDDCQRLFKQFAKVVYCNDTKCGWFTDVPEDFKKSVAKFKGYVSPWPGNFAKGLCTRAEILLEPSVIEQLKIRKLVATCTVRWGRESTSTPRNQLEKMLKQDGTVEGGSLESQSQEQNYTSEAFH